VISYIGYLASACAATISLVSGNLVFAGLFVMLSAFLLNEALDLSE